MSENRRKRPGNAPTHPLPSGKRRAFMAITLLLPVLLLACIELVLQLTRYGPDISLFKSEQIAGRDYLIMNPDVKNRYFSSVAFSPNTSLDYFQDPKPPGAFRIFCLGGSTTVGFPYGYAGSFAAYLRDRLRLIFPERMIEVINLGMTATNSFTVNDIARELVGYQPDLFIVYDGHNEFYGALGKASHEGHGSARWMTRAYLRLVHLRTFLLVRDIYGKVQALFRSDSHNEPGGTMMERLARGKYIARGSPAYLSCLEDFRANLDELAELCRNHGIRLMLSSQVSNLRDRAPFIPGEQRTLPREELVKFNSLLEQGSAQFQLGHPDSALEILYAAVAIDSVRSGIQYLIGRSYDHLGLFATAREAYARARDDDMLRFRTSSDFNNAIAAAAGTGGALFVDMERAFAGVSPDSLVGSTLILEHLHPNERGYFLMAREYARVMRAEGILAPGSAWKRADSLSEDSLWNHRGLTEHDIRCADLRIRTLTSGWPFQSGEAAVPAVDPTDPFALLSQHVTQGELNWEQGHVAAAELFERRKDLINARKEYRALIRMIPINVSAYLLLGQTYLRTEELDSATHILRASLAVEPTSFACRTIASIEIDWGHPTEALPFLARAALLASGNGERAEIAFLEGVANERLGKREMAVLKLEEAIRLDPSSRRARQFLGKLTSQ